jgi:hypothetical protein
MISLLDMGLKQNMKFTYQKVYELYIFSLYLSILS